jgi:hypothetical protein
MEGKLRGWHALSGSAKDFHPSGRDGMSFLTDSFFLSFHL